MRRPAAMLVVLATSLLATTVAPAHAQDGDPEPRTLGIVRRVVPYDGRVTQEIGEEVTVTLDGDVLFEFDRADLTAPARATLTDLAADIAERGTGGATVIGHTDAIGTDAYNLDLSRRRAAAVEGFLAPLVEGAVTFSVDGRGEAEPVAPNERPDGSDDADGRRRNRRVEVTYTVTGT